MVALDRDPSGLYLPAAAPSDNALFFVFADPTIAAASIDVATELAGQRGFLLFADSIPADAAGRATLAADARAEMKAIPPARIGWIEQANGGSRVLFALFLARAGNVLRLAPEQTGLGYKQSFRFRLREGLSVAWSEADAELAIDNATQRCSIIGSGGAVTTIGAVLRVPALGPDAGRFLFDLTANDQALDVLEVGLRIFSRRGGPFPGVSSTRFPVFDASAESVNLRAVLDPLEISATRSAAGLPATALRFDTGTALTTHYRTDAGHPLVVTPAPGARLAFCDRTESLQTDARKFYLVPDGDFAVGAPQESLADVPREANLLAGATGTEYVKLPPQHMLRFRPGHPALRTAAPTASGPFLEPGATTAWVDIASAGTADYVGEPEDAPLYGSRAAVVDALADEAGAAPPMFAFEEHEKRTFDASSSAVPLLPLGGVDGADLDAALALESDVVSRQRRLGVSDVPRARSAVRALAEEETQPRRIMTPHGLIRQFDAAGAEDLLIARDRSQAQIEFLKLEEKFRDAISRNRLLLVMSRNGGSFGAFASKTSIAGWQFDLKIDLGTNLGDQAIVILKFDDTPLFTLLQRPELWAEPDTFNADVAGVSRFLIDYFTPIVNSDKPEHRRLRAALTEPAWNGVLAVNATIELPPEAKCLAAGLPDVIRAHHIGLDLNDVDAAQGLELRDSSFFALLDYSAAFEEPAAGDLYAFQVTRLQVLFENSRITDFQCTAILFARTLFDDDLTPPSKFTIAGHYENHDGKETYTFLNEDPHELAIDSAVIRTILVTGIALITVDANDSRIVSRFLITGSIAFEDLSRIIGLDFFSFEALHFDRTALEMVKTAGVTKPEIRFDAGEIGVDVKLNDLRGLLKHFPLKLKRFRRFARGIRLPDLGVIPLFELPDAGCPAPRYALYFDLDLGSFGGLTSTKDFKAELLLAWCGNSVWGGIRLPESKGGPKSLGLQGVIQILVDDFAFRHFEPDVYVLVLRGCAIEILGVRFPAGERPDIYIFVDPKRLSNGQDAGIGWLLSTPSQDIGPFAIERFVLGQRVGPPLAGVRTVTEALDALTKLPPTDTDVNRDLFANRLSNLFQPNRGWLIGTKMKIGKQLTFGFVFNDPVLYGALLRIEEPVGFEIEITYRKITEDIGVYHAEVTLPESIRQWEFGAVSVTIPTIGISVFTNGDFVLDVGYPHNLDFSRSCTVQALPFLGSGGFYYGKLNPSTSTALPIQGLETVVEIGFGVRLGLGKELSKGILKAGLSVAVYGLLEGALGYLEGADWTDPSEYLVRGRVGIIAQIFGVVDFGIVKAGVAITLSVGVGIELGSRVDTVLWIEGRVSVQVEVVIGRIRIWRMTIEIKISFSFSTEVRFSWVLERKSAQSAVGGARAFALAAGDAQATPLSWDLPAAPAARIPVRLFFIPEVTLIAKVPHMVGGLAVTAPAGADSPQTDFDRIVDEIVRWCVTLHAGGDDPEVTPEMLLALDARLHLPKTLARTREADATKTPLDHETLCAFLGQTFDLSVNGVEDQDRFVATFFPMIPDASMTVSLDGQVIVRRDLWSFNLRDETYQDALATYFRDLSVNLEAVQLAPRTTLRSLATIVFADYFDFIVKAAVDLLWRRMIDRKIATEKLSRLLADTPFDDLAGMAARFFKQGLRIPSNNAMTQTAALYDQLGLQVALPRPASAQNEVKVALELRNVAHQCAHSGAVAPAVILDDGFFAELDTLDLDIEPEITIAQSDPIRVDRRRFALQRWAQWNRAGGDALLWPLPPSLETELRKPATTEIPMRLVVGDADHPFRGEGATEIRSAYSWATRVDLTMRRIAAPGGALIEDVFEIGGTTERNRLYLDDLLAAIDATQPPRIELLFGTGAGLVSPAVDPATVLLVRGNYSTETTPPPESLPLAAFDVAAAAFVDRAPMNDPVAFLRLAQECSLVNTGGYFLRYDHAKLPAGFPQGADPAVITLVITGGNDAGKPVRRHHNALAIESAGRVRDAVDPSNRLVFYAEATAKLEEAITLIEPGCVAFEVTRPNPALAPFSWLRELENLYNLLEYKVPQQTGFRASHESLPLTPLESGAKSATPEPVWRYQQVVPVHRLATAPGLYASTGTDVAIDFDFRDCFGNKLHASRPAARRAFAIRYFDKLVGSGAWPGVATAYRVVKDGNAARLVLTFDFDPRAFAQQTAEAGKAVVDRVKRIAAQLTGPGVKLSVRSTLRGANDHVLSNAEAGKVATFVGAIHSFLERGTAAPQPLQLSIPTAGIATLQPFFELTVAFAIEREDPKTLDAGVVARDPEVARVVSDIAPQTDSGSLTSASLRHFAEELEKAIPALRVAVGTAAAGGAGVWAVRLGPGGAIDVQADAQSVRFYAVPPITTDRFPGDVDYDVLGRRFLEAVDWFVGPELAPHVARIAPQAFDSVAGGKRDLADAVSNQLAPLLAKHHGAADPLLSDARETLRQKLLIALATAYKVDVVVAYPCRVTSPLGGERAPKLYGSIDAKAPGGARTPPLGVTPAKLDVGTGGTATRTLAFLLDVFTERNVSSLPLELSYAITHFEYFAPSAERDRFSRWLKFVTPVTPESLGTPNVPVPLRQYPVAPRIEHRSIAGAQPPAASPIARAREWTYEVAFEADNAAQDTLTVEIELNVQQRVAFALDAEESLLDVLARFDRTYPAIQAELRNIASTGAGDAARLVELADLVRDVARAWRNHANSAVALSAASGAAERLLRYDVREERPQDDRIVVTVARHDPAMPLPQTMTADQWRLASRRPNGNTVTFTFAPAGAPVTTRRRALLFAPFDVLGEESAWSSVKLARNAVLAGEPAHEQFIYRTPVVRASEPIVVLRAEHAPIAIPPLGSGASAPLATHLAKLFEAVFARVEQPARRVKVETRYAFDLRRGTIGGADAVTARVPLQLTPPFDLAIPEHWSSSSYVTALEGVIRAWHAERSPSADGSLLFDVTVYAAAGAESLPVLRLTNLQLPLQSVTFP